MFLIEDAIMVVSIPGWPLEVVVLEFDIESGHWR